MNSIQTSNQFLPEVISKGWWWECRSSHQRKFKEAVHVGIFDYLWDRLCTSNWDQSLLTIPCVEPNCDSTMSITYLFPRAGRTKLSVISIVGPALEVAVQKAYLPMMWETIPEDEPETRWFDFKYISKGADGKKQAYGLARPAVLDQNGLADLFQRYSFKASIASFP